MGGVSGLRANFYVCPISIRVPIFLRPSGLGQQVIPEIPKEDRPEQSLIVRLSWVDPHAGRVLRLSVMCKRFSAAKTITACLTAQALVCLTGSAIRMPSLLLALGYGSPFYVSKVSPRRTCLTTETRFNHCH